MKDDDDWGLHMTDLELLELAAKAAGYELESSIGSIYPYATQFRIDGNAWNPLTDDGDALRLAVKISYGREPLQLMLPDGDDHCAVVGDYGRKFQVREFNRDPAAALRRAIVRCAARMGSVE